MSVIREKLRQYVSQGGRRFLDYLYVKQVRMKFRDAVPPENGTLTAGLLLNNILNSPTDTIKACLKSEKAAPPDPRFDLSSLNQILGLAANGPKEDGNDDNGYNGDDDDNGDDDGDGDGVVSGLDEETGATASERSPEENRKQLDELVDRVKKFRRHLLETVKGQDNAVSVFTAGYFHGEISSLVDTGCSRPRPPSCSRALPGWERRCLPKPRQIISVCRTSALI